MVKVGDALPSVPVQEGAPDKTIDLSKELKDGYLIGVPGKLNPRLLSLLHTTTSTDRATSPIYLPQHSC